MEAEIRPAAGTLAVDTGGPGVGEPGPRPDPAAAGAAALARIGAEPHAYNLFAALRLIECARADLPRLGEASRPCDEPVRIGQDPSLAFAAGAVQRVEPADERHPARLIQRVLGLFGSNGPLPLHLSEFAFERQHHAGDQTFVRFADIFHHRLLSLFYRAWAVNQPTVSLDRPGQDRFGAYVGALCGLGMPAWRERDSVGDFVKLGHASIFGRQVKCAEGLQIVLANHFGVPVRIEQWRGHWLDIPPSERSRLGCLGGFATLGEDVVIGERLWDCQGMFRIVLGPLALDDYRRFLPDGRGYRKLGDLVRLYIGVELGWDLQLVLKREQVPEPTLGGSLALGWTSWLGRRPAQRDADDLVLAEATKCDSNRP